MRIAIVGSSCAGKSTLARELAVRQSLPHIELDALHWEPNWTAAEPDAFRERVGRATAEDRWVCDGNYSMVRDLIWPRADTLVWLHYSFATVWMRAVQRTLRRSYSGEELYNGNRESFAKAFCSRDSILLWVLTSFRRRNRELTAAIAQPQHARLNVVPLRKPRDTQRWLDQITSGAKPTQLSMPSKTR